VKKCGTNKKGRKTNKENRESQKERGRKIEIIRKKKRLWKINIEFKRERRASDAKNFRKRMYTFRHCTVHFMH
jgi:hypothetical protein